MATRLSPLMKRLQHPDQNLADEELLALGRNPANRAPACRISANSGSCSDRACIVGTQLFLQRQKSCGLDHLEHIRFGPTGAGTSPTALRPPLCGVYPGNRLAKLMFGRLPKSRMRHGTIGFPRFNKSLANSASFSLCKLHSAATTRPPRT